MPLGKFTSTRPLRHIPDLPLVLVATLLLCLPAIWNGFPLVYSDTGAYLATAFEGKIPMARPTGYGLFIRYTAIAGNLWLPLFAQSLIFAWLLLRAIRTALPNPNSRITYAIATTIIFTLTGITWYASQLMPDIFTGLVVLAVFILFFDATLTFLPKAVVAIVLYLFCFAHYSHAALLLTLTAIMTAFWTWQKLRRKAIPFSFPRILWASAPALFAILSFYYVNYSNDLGWRMTRSSHVFTMARLSETGLLQEYLHESCPDNHWSLCPYADSLPATAADFIWSEQSPFKKTGYWEGSRPGYDSLLSDFFSRGHYLKGYLKETAKAGIAQLSELSVGEGITPYNESSSPYKFFERAMPDKLPAFTASRQFAREFSFAWEKPVLYTTMVVSILILLTIGIHQRHKMNHALLAFALLAALGYVANAFLTGALANVYSRLQSRIAWLIPLAACLFLISFIRNFRG